MVRSELAERQEETVEDTELLREELGELADEVVCLQRPSRFMAVGQWYEEFGQTTDAEVQQLLEASPVPDSAAGLDAGGK